MFSNFCTLKVPALHRKRGLPSVNSKGFTTVELLIVLGILGILLALGISSIVGTYFSYRSSTRSIIEKVRGDVLRARASAKGGVVDPNPRTIRISDYQLPDTILIVSNDNPVAGAETYSSVSQFVFETQTGRLNQSGCLVLRDVSANETYGLYVPQVPTEIGIYKKVGETWSLYRGL